MIKQIIHCEIPKTNEDLKEKIAYNWDAMTNSTLLDVYCIPGFYHSIGGRKGLNDLYCCNRGKELTIENIMPFSGEACKWDIEFISNNYYKNSYSSEGIEHNHRLNILRNNSPFYTLSSYSLDYLMAKAKLLMVEIEEHPISFQMKNYEKEIINRKILWKQCPSIIVQYSQSCNMVIIPDGTEEQNKTFHKYGHCGNGENYIVEDLFSNSIFWFRSEENKDQ